MNVRGPALLLIPLACLACDEGDDSINAPAFAQGPLSLVQISWRSLSQRAFEEDPTDRVVPPVELSLPGCQQQRLPNSTLVGPSITVPMPREARDHAIRVLGVENTRVDGQVVLLDIFNGLFAEGIEVDDLPSLDLLNGVARLVDEEGNDSQLRACAFNYQILPPLFTAILEVQTGGAIRIIPDSLNRTGATCTSSETCVGRVRETDEEGMSILITAPPGVDSPPRVRANPLCRLSNVSRSGTSNAWSASITVTKNDVLCSISFQDQSTQMVPMPVIVRGDTIVTYGVQGDEFTCSGISQGECEYAVPFGGRLQFTAQAVTDWFPVWKGACTRDSRDPWHAVVPSVQLDSACEFELKQEDTNCEEVEDPIVKIEDSSGELIRLEEFYFTVPNEDVTLMAEGAVVEPATYTWSVESDGRFFELPEKGSAVTTRLQCAKMGFCELRVDVSDACGTRQTGALFVNE